MSTSTAIRLSILIVSAVISAALSPLQSGDTTSTSLQRVTATEKGKLTNPLTITPQIIAEGQSLYQAKTCGACHGSNGGGIHCPSLINSEWIYDGDDDTLFRLIALGSSGLETAGYKRSDKEKHAGPMPGFAEAIPNEGDIWKIIAYIRSLEPK